MRTGTVPARLVFALYERLFSSYSASVMKILIIGRKESYAMLRFKEEGLRCGVHVVVAQIEDLRFEITEGMRSVFIGQTDILSKFDVILPLRCKLYFSEMLMLSEWAASRGVRVIDSALSHGEFVSSKTYDLWKLAEKGLPVPSSIQCMDMQDVARAFEQLGAPLIAKGVHGSQGRWVFKVESLKELESQFNGQQSGFFVFQKYLEIEEEYRIMTIGGKPVGMVRKTPLKGDFRANYSLGAHQEQVPLTPHLSILAETASRILRYQFAGVDIAISGKKPYILEVNRSPGFKGFEAVTNLNVAKSYIEYVITNWNRRSSERGKVHALHGHHKKTS